jgi:hypothetical protein
MREEVAKLDGVMDPFELEIDRYLCSDLPVLLYRVILTSPNVHCIIFYNYSLRLFHQ